MSDDATDITPDALRMAGYDDRSGVFARPGREDDYWLMRVAGHWLFAGRACDPATPATVADVRRLTLAAEATLTPLED